MTIEAALARVEQERARLQAEVQEGDRKHDAWAKTWSETLAQRTALGSDPADVSKVAEMTALDRVLEHLEGVAYPAIRDQQAATASALATVNAAGAVLALKAAVLRDLAPVAGKAKAALQALAADLADMDAVRNRLRTEHGAVPAELLHRILDVEPDLTRTTPHRVRALVERAFEGHGALLENPGARYDAEALARFAERLDQDLSAAELARIAELVKPAAPRAPPGPPRMTGYTTGGRAQRFA